MRPETRIAPAVHPRANPFDLSGRAALVTGAGRGIGAAIAARLSAAGAAVALHDRSGASGELAGRLAEEGAPAVAVTGDLATPEAPARAVTEAHRALGRLDLLVANAGVQPVTPLAEVDDAELEEVLATNLSASFRLLRSAAGLLADGGAVVLVASIEAVHPLPGHAHYAASKAGLAQLARAAAGELGPRLRVNAVAPGLTRREGIDVDWPDGVARYAAAAALGRLVEPEEVAEAVLFLACPAASAITGTTLTVDAGVTATSAF